MAHEYEGNMINEFDFIEENTQDYPERHIKGRLLIENKELIESYVIRDFVDFGIQISKDGRIWICINGVAFLRFKPTK